jgi:hypothetical protein
MSKRKRAPKQQPADDSTDDASMKDDMVHVTPDLLAGGPDIFAAKKTADAPADESAAEAVPETEPAAAEDEPPPPAPEIEAVEPPEASVALTPPEEPAALEPPPPAPPAPPPPPYVPATPYPSRPRRAGASAALGVVLVVVGIFALAVALTGADLTASAWPLFILVPGLTLLIAGFVGFGSVATIPGGIVTMLGVVLAYTNSSGDWPFWAYGWALVVPFGVGLGMYLQALRDRDQQALRSGRTLLSVGFMIFLIGFVLFESILGISGRDTFGPVGKAALPVLLIIVGVILFARSWQRSRQV